MTKVLVGFPVGDSALPAFVKSLCDLQRYELLNPSPDYELLPIEYSAGLYVEENRNKLVDLAKDQGADWLFQIDTDEKFQPNLLRQLMSSADVKERPIVFGLYSNVVRAPQAVEGGYYCIDMIFREVENGEYMNINPPSDFSPFYVDAAGSGILLTHMSVFDKIEYPYFTVDYIRLTGKTRLQFMNEDISFCRKARLAGFKLLVDPLSDVQHHKTIALLPGPFKHFMDRARQVQDEFKRMA
jgi:GT2 family glycosyltransferase